MGMTNAQEKKISIAESADDLDVKLRSLQHKQEKSPTIYFGYGSNLWREQMSLRCPLSQYLGVGRLQGYRWMINNRGYANVVLNPGTDVYGLVYTLSYDDERSLDRNEGVPFAYTKELLWVEFWSSKNGSPVDLNSDAEKVEMLVYIDRERTVDARPKEEYVHRMNNGIRDGLLEGIPREYVQSQLRSFISIRGEEELGDLAKRQASSFEDET